MPSREEILKAVRSHRPPLAAKPDLAGHGVVYPDRRRRFADLLKSVGGRCVFVADLAALNQSLADFPEYIAAQKIVSLVPGAGTPTCDLSQIADPHQLEDIDIAILPGQFAVAENGAVWVDDRALKHRVIYFIVQHLVLVVPAAELVDNMHQAYQRLTFAGPGFGAFISGPSKTADIEQSLVIGAHGARSLTVFFVE